MNQTVLHPDTARLDESKHTGTSHNNMVDVYSASIEILGDEAVTIRPNIIDAHKPVFVDPVSQPVKSQYQTDIDTHKRIQRLRAQAILQSHNAAKKNIITRHGSDNWKLIVGYTIAILLAVLLVLPFVNHVATALAAF